MSDFCTSQWCTTGSIHFFPDRVAVCMAFWIECAKVLSWGLAVLATAKALIIAWWWTGRHLCERCTKQHRPTVSQSQRGKSNLTLRNYGGRLEGWRRCLRGEAWSGHLYEGCTKQHRSTISQSQRGKSNHTLRNSGQEKKKKKEYQKEGDLSALSPNSLWDSYPKKEMCPSTAVSSLWKVDAESHTM